MPPPSLGTIRTCQRALLRHNRAVLGHMHKAAKTPGAAGVAAARRRRLLSSLAALIRRSLTAPPPSAERAEIERLLAEAAKVNLN